MCIDLDGDGFGFECKKGEDCDDSNAELKRRPRLLGSERGLLLARPAQSQWTACSRASTPNRAAFLCKSGVRYCPGRGLGAAARVSVASRCSALSTALSKLGVAAISPDAALAICDVCKARLATTSRISLGVDGGNVDAAVPNGHDVVFTPGGGITSCSELDDSGHGAQTPDGPPTDIRACDMVTDTDCNGIPDLLDEDYGKPKVANQLPAIFMELGPRESESRGFEVEFFINSVDIYFLVDTTGSMGGSVAKLVDSLTTGNYLGDLQQGVRRRWAATASLDNTLDGRRALRAPSRARSAMRRSVPVGFARCPPAATRRRGTCPSTGVQDISTDPYQDADGALDTFAPATNNSAAPEAPIVALQAVATGGTEYMGWGSPRHSAPHVFRFGDLWVPVLPQERRARGDAHYGRAAVQRTQSCPGTYGTFQQCERHAGHAYNPIPNTNETIGNQAYNVLGGAAVDTDFVTYTGDTRLMSADLHRGMLRVGCHHV